jgi:hypothetical protein
MIAVRRLPPSSGIRARAGLAPVELVLALPIWLMIAALMLLVGTTAAWKIRGRIVAREAAFRALWPRTRASDPVPDEWFPPSATMSVSPTFPAISSDDPLSSHPVIRGPRLVDPRTRRELAVDGSVMEPNSDAISGSAGLNHPAEVWRRLGFHYRVDLAFPILDGDAGQWDPTAEANGDSRRSLRIWEVPMAAEL